MAQFEKAGGIAAAQTPMRTDQDAGMIFGLREQIKSNAAILFHAGNVSIAQPGLCDVVLMTTNTTEPFPPGETPKYHAALTYIVPGSMSPRWSIAATGQPRDGLIPALESLLYVLAAAMEKYQGNIIKSPPATPVEVAGGMIDETAVLGKSWKVPFLGREKN